MTDGLQNVRAACSAGAGVGLLASLREGIHFLPLAGAQPVLCASVPAGTQPTPRGWSGLFSSSGVR